MLYERLKQIENKAEGEEYSEGGIAFYMCCDKVSMTLEDLEPLKDVSVKNKIFASEDNLELIKVEDPLSDLKRLCAEWHFGPDITQDLVDVLNDTDTYYQVSADGSYSSYGYLWSQCRLFVKGDEFIIVEFFICD